MTDTLITDPATGRQVAELKKLELNAQKQKREALSSAATHARRDEPHSALAAIVRAIQAQERATSYFVAQEVVLHHTGGDE